ncbi:MAG: GPW/gp25 family protein [Kofleriaceae bacterium]
MNKSPLGLLSPFGRDQKRDFASGGDPALVHSKVAQVLATEGQTPRSTGELLWRTAFGSGLHLLRHQRNDDVLAALAQVYVRDAFARWLPEVALVRVVVQRVDAVLHLRVRYRLRGDGSEGTAAITL